VLPGISETTLIVTGFVAAALEPEPAATASRHAPAIAAAAIAVIRFDFIDLPFLGTGSRRCGRC
jgi:hypothetical protein